MTVRYRSKRHPALRITDEVHVAHASARVRDYCLSDTHVIVGDHPPEPRMQHEHDPYRALAVEIVRRGEQLG